MKKNDVENPNVCATIGCGRPAALTYLGRPRCQKCYEDEVADGDEISETHNHEETTIATTKSKAERAPTGDAKPKHTSALDAAAEVLRNAGEALNCPALITKMAEGGLWTSPNGKTPHATLHAAINREIKTKGKEARFRKAERGKFEYAG